MFSLLACALAVIAPTSNLPVQSSTLDLNKFVYPMAKPIPCPPVETDVTDSPDSAAWAAAAKELTINWFPTLTSLLATENYKAPAKITLTFKKDLNVPAYASGGGITINGKWIHDHPNDLGMVVHELVHVIQMYPGYKEKPGWLVEGVADYIRWWRYEPEVPRVRPNPEKANYSDSYRTTGWWLGWVSQKYDRRLVPALDRAMRNKQDPMPIFQQMTGKSPEELWKEFIESK